MKNSVVYLDVVFLGNMAVNYLVLLAAGKLGRVKGAHWRLAAGAGLGGLYAAALLLPVWPYFLSPPVKVVVSMIMVLVSFYPAPFRRMLACLGFLYAVSFLLGGAVLGFSYLLARNDTLFRGYSTLTAGPGHKYIWPLVFLTALLFLGAARLLPGYLKSRAVRESLRCPLVIGLWGNTVTIQALLDTGNNLTEPLSGAPVIIVEYGAVRALLPVNLQQSLESGAGPLEMLPGVVDDAHISRLALIPFRSLGNERGLLLGLKPDSLSVVLEHGTQEIKGAVLGIHKSCLDPGREYAALLNPDILRKKTA